MNILIALHILINVFQFYILTFYRLLYFEKVIKTRQTIMYTYYIQVMLESADTLVCTTERSINI